MSRDVEIANLKTTLGLDIGDFKKQLSSASKETTNLKKSFDIASKAIENAEDTIDATANAISKGEKAMDSMNKKLELQKKRYDDLKSTIQNQSTQYDKLSQDLKKAEHDLDGMNNASEKNVDAIKEQEQAIEALKKELSNKAALIDKNINKLQSYSNDIDRTENDIQGLSNQLGKLKNSFDDVSEATEGASGGGLEQFKELSNEAGIDLGLLELSAKGAALALAVVITKSVIDGATNYDKAITDLQITMGITEDSAKDLYTSIQDISEGGYSLEGIGEAVQILQQRFNLSAEETENLAQGMDILNKYGYESKDITRFMTTAVNDWGMTYEGALDYILKGQQEGLNISDDWMDTLVEYAPLFSTLGVNGNDAFLLIQEAVKATGVDTDKAADMVKEFMLTLTDGSSTSAEAFDALGINLDDLNSQIDNGSITSVEAMQKVMGSIMDVGSETEQARLLQEIFKGTVEYGSIGIVEAWANMENSVVDTTGTIDGAKEAFEGSYEAAKQDLSNSWNELSQTIGSKATPALIWVVDLLNTVAITVLNIGPLMKNMFLQMGNDITQWSLGAVGKFQEFQIACIEGAIKIAEVLGKDEWATKWKTSLDGVKQKHSETVNKIIENENERSRIETEDQALRDQIYGKDKQNHTAKADSIVNDNEKVKKSSDDLNNKLQTDSDTSASKVSQNANKMGTGMASGMNNAKNAAETSMQGVKSAVDSNMDGSLQTVQVQATEMYKGVKTSFHKMSQSAREDGTEMYKGVQTSANKMASSAKQAATDMYKGVTTSTSRMADKAIADWNRVKNAYATPVKANISVTQTKTTVNQSVSAGEPISLDNNIENSRLRFNLPKIRQYQLSDGYYNIDNTIKSSGSDNKDKILSDILKKLTDSNKSINLNIENFINNRDVDVEDLLTEISHVVSRKSILE